MKKLSMGLLSRLFGSGSNVDFAELIVNGATVIDVRSPQEFRGGHPKGAVNIPLDQIGSKMKKIQSMRQPIIVCCASGMRSGRAKGMIESNGIEVYNAGGWRNLS